MAVNLWFFSALGAAILWGISYVVAERVLKMGMTPASLMFIGAFISTPLYLALAWWLDEIKPSFQIISGNWRILILVVMASVATVAGNFFILVSVGMKNATMASLVEISYPLFTMFFAWLLFREVQVSWTSAMGGLLILVGVSIIYIKG